MYWVIILQLNQLHIIYRTDLDKRRAEKERLEEERRKENMDKLRKDMEKSGGESVVLSTGLKNKNMELDEDEEDEEEDDDERFSEDGSDIIDNDEDEEIASFSFWDHFSEIANSCVDWWNEIKCAVCPL